MQPLPDNIHPQTPMITRGRILKTVAGIAVALVPTARQFGFRPTLALAGHTLWQLFRNLPDSKQESRSGTTLLTFSVYPDLTRIWYTLARKHLGRDIQILVVDCSGLLQAAHFPDAQLARFWNFSHSRKIDWFIRHTIETRHVWLCDDDVMFVNPHTFKVVQHFFTLDRIAAVSLAPRSWHLLIAGQKNRGMGSYCLLFDRAIFISEKLSFSPVKSNDPNVGRITGYYDTADYANRILLERGYKIEFYLGQDECEHVCGFVGSSTARLSLLAGRQAALQELSSLTQQVRAYRLIGYYCDWLVVRLYRNMFAEEPEWIPSISEREICEMIEALEDEFRDNAQLQIERYENHYFRILQAASALNPAAPLSC